MTKVTPEIAISKELQKLAKNIDKKIHKVAGQRLGFSLVIFNNEPGARINYISNCDRKEVINALQSLLIGWGEGMPDVPAHKVN